MQFSYFEAALRSPRCRLPHSRKRAMHDEVIHLNTNRVSEDDSSPAQHPSAGTAQHTSGIYLLYYVCRSKIAIPTFPATKRFPSAPRPTRFRADPISASASAAYTMRLLSVLCTCVHNATELV